MNSSPGSTPPFQNSQMNVAIGKRILIFNDQETVFCFLRDKLENLGFTVSLATSIEQGLILLQESAIHGILLDFELSGKKRMATLQAIKKHSNGSPIIVMSADPTQTAMMKAMEAGARDYLTKPISPVILKYKCLRLFS